MSKYFQLTQTPWATVSVAATKRGYIKVSRHKRFRDKMLRSSLILRPSSARSVRNVFKTSNRTSFTAFVRNAVLPLQRDASLARKSIFALGALSACAAMPRKFTSSEAAEAPKGFKMVRRVADNGDIATVTASSVGEVVNSCEEADVVCIPNTPVDFFARSTSHPYMRVLMKGLVLACVSGLDR